MNVVGTGRSQTRQASRGFTLVELMVAMVLGLMLTAAVASLFIANQRNYRRNNLVAEMQDNARFAIQALADDLAMAGFLGGIQQPGQVEVLDASMPAVLAGDCGPGLDGMGGWAFDTNALGFVNDATGASVTATFGCLSTGNLVDGNDVLAVHFASAFAGGRNDNGSSPSLQANTFYLRSNRTTGQLFYSGSGAVDAANAQSPLWYYRYTSHLYFVSPWNECEPGDDSEPVPTLCRARIDHGDARPDVELEPVAEGVEKLEIVFGIDTDGDGVANLYRRAPNKAQLARAVTARITLLMRSVKPDDSYRNQKTYDLVLYDASTGYTPNDHHYRRVLQTTVILRNAAAGR